MRGNVKVSYHGKIWQASLSVIIVIFGTNHEANFSGAQQRQSFTDKGIVKSKYPLCSKENHLVDKCFKILGHPPNHTANPVNKTRRNLQPVSYNQWQNKGIQ